MTPDLRRRLSVLIVPQQEMPPPSRTARAWLPPALIAVKGPATSPRTPPAKEVPQQAAPPSDNTPHACSPRHRSPQRRARQRHRLSECTDPPGSATPTSQSLSRLCDTGRPVREDRLARAFSHSVRQTWRPPITAGRGSTRLFDTVALAVTRCQAAQQRTARSRWRARSIELISPPGCRSASGGSPSTAEPWGAPHPLGRLRLRPQERPRVSIGVGPPTLRRCVYASIWMRHQAEERL